MQLRTLMAVTGTLITLMGSAAALADADTAAGAWLAARLAGLLAWHPGLLTVHADGEGGTLVPGMYEMHGHLGQGNALLNIAAGVTSVRDMGNENAVLEDLMRRIDAGIIAGPRITRSCFIEGESEFSAATGETVSTLEEALAMVRWCASRDFHQAKFYNSMKPEWAETLVAEAHRLGLRVAGHVPAFSTANDMIEVGFDEITHANQLMLGWVLEDGEDTRTLFRFTAMKRFPALDAKTGAGR